jgi:hypothetical protein
LLEVACAVRCMGQINGRSALTAVDLSRAQVVR